MMALLIPPPNRPLAVIAMIRAVPILEHTRGTVAQVINMSDGEREQPAQLVACSHGRLNIPTMHGFKYITCAQSKFEIGVCFLSCELT